MRLRDRIGFVMAESLSAIAGILLVSSHVIGGGIFIGVAMYVAYLEGRYAERAEQRLTR